MWIYWAYSHMMNVVIPSIASFLNKMLPFFLSLTMNDDQLYLSRMTDEIDIVM